MNKSTLIVANDVWEDSFDSVGNGFGNNFEDNIAQGDRSIVTRGHRVFDLGN
jgi:hypothetical protein